MSLTHTFIEGVFFGMGFAFIYVHYEHTIPWLWKKYVKKKRTRAKKEKDNPLRVVK